MPRHTHPSNHPNHPKPITNRAGFFNICHNCGSDPHTGPCTPPAPQPAPFTPGGFTDATTTL